jgi:hypothetical protein
VLFQPSLRRTGSFELRLQKRLRSSAGCESRRRAAGAETGDLVPLMPIFASASILRHLPPCCHDAFQGGGCMAIANASSAHATEW